MTIVYARPPKRPPKQAKPKPAPALPAVVVTPDAKRTRILRAERWAAQHRDPSPEVEAFFARNVRSGGPLPPHKR
jgi:hypothetical protein